MVDAPNPADEPVTIKHFIDEVLVMAANTVPALLFLVVYGLILAGHEPGIAVLTLLLSAIGIDLLSEYWVYTTPYRYDSARLERIVHIHTGLLVLAYCVLIATFTLLQNQLFLAYSAFLVLWLLSFMIGEALLMFLDDPHETPTEL